ncbi:MAG TPA: HDOD domain-containing protein, partial [Candidatus Angelobacter sp.]|nr:HDOD domain-containing protein [Candidatus Angelobacter sp.]
LDLLLGQRALDLQAIVGIIQSDVGACLQLLRVTRARRGESESSVGLIEECVIQLGRLGLRRETRSAFPVAAGPRYEAAQQFWTRAWLSAELAKTMASHVPEVRPADAHLAGLLHKAGRIPELLGWTSQDLDFTDPVATGRAMLREWALPAVVGPTLLSSGPRQPACLLQQVVVMASNLANAICNRQRLSGRATDALAGVRTRPSFRSPQLPESENLTRL